MPLAEFFREIANNELECSVTGFVFRGILLSPGLHSMGSGAGNDIFLSPGMLLNMEVFAYAFAVCVALNLLSSMIPAWRTVRVSITDALNDK